MHDELSDNQKMLESLAKRKANLYNNTVSAKNKAKRRAKNKAARKARKRKQVTMQRERYMIEVSMLVSVDALDLSDAEDILLDIFGQGELDGFGITCHSVDIHQTKKS